MRNDVVDVIHFTGYVRSSRYCRLNWLDRCPSPKSATSRRMIHVGETTVRLLQGHKAEQAEYRLQLGGVYENNGLVFTSLTGGMLDPGTLSKSRQRLCKREGMKF